MKQILREEDLPLTGEFRPSAVLGAISRAKNEMLDPAFLAENAANHRERTIARLASRYQAAAAQGRARSTSTTCCSRRSGSSTRRPRSSRKYQERWRYLHVDEYQDTNRAAIPVGQGAGGEAPQPRRRRRRRPVDLLVARRGPAQHPRLRARLADAAVVKLEQNYRSTQLILDAAHAVVSRNDGAQGQEALDRQRRRRCRSSASRPTTRKRRPSGSPARSRA